jgi:organic hydroperoxide reductase OsmC/OhrA
VHSYRALVAWSGSTAGGYDAYDRRHVAEIPPGRLPLALSSDPAFRGDPALPNPEQLLVLAAASCQLLSFLTVAARARLDVLEYSDEAEGEMSEDNRIAWVERIRLRPRVTVRDPAGKATEARIVHLLEVAHRECYIARSVKTEILLEPQITLLTG